MEPAYNRASVCDTVLICLFFSSFIFTLFIPLFCRLKTIPFPCQFNTFTSDIFCIYQPTLLIIFWYNVTTSCFHPSIFSCVQNCALDPCPRVPLSYRTFIRPETIRLHASAMLMPAHACNAHVCQLGICTANGLACCI
jgi:hypothetical protein